jgi:hypothetical protein
MTFNPSDDWPKKTSRHTIHSLRQHFCANTEVMLEMLISSYQQSNLTVPPLSGPT